MKQFFKTFFASLLAFVAGSGCLVIFLVIALTGMVASLASLGGGRTEPIQLKANTILKVDVSSLSDVMSTDPLSDIVSGDETKRAVSLTDAIMAIRKAKNNPNISGIYLNVEQLSAGQASVDALRRALIDFRSSGKPILSYGDTYTQKAYYLSSVADRVALNPQGAVELIGIAAGHMMFKDALDKLGVKMEIFRVGTFKSAVEPFMLNKMSDDNRRQVQEYVDGLWNTIVEGIASAKGLSPDSLRAFVDAGSAFDPAESFLKAGLVDTLVYRAQIKDMFAEHLGLEDANDLHMVNLADMANVPEEPGKAKSTFVRVIYAEGEIGTSSSPYSFASMIDYSLVDKLREVADKDDVKAVVLRVNSPGGSAFISEQIWHAVKELRTKKPVVVSMGDLAASGGYYISAAANKIVAEGTTLTGSIGIFGMFPNVSKIVSDFGVHIDVVQTSKYADMMMDMRLRPLSPEQRMLIQRMVERGYETFLSRVAEGRGMTRDQVDSVGQGRVWLGAKAKELGLVDELGGLDRAIEEAAKLAALDEYIIDYGQTSRNIYDDLFKSLESTDDFVARLRARFMTEDERKLMRLYQGVTHGVGIQARLPLEFMVY